MLFWSIGNKCVHPIHGHLLAVKAKGKSARVVAGGTCMGFQTNGKHSSSFVVGSEGGHLFRCSLREGRAKVQPPADALNDGWTPEGWALLCRLRSRYVVYWWGDVLVGVHVGGETCALLRGCLLICFRFEYHDEHDHY